MRVSVFGSSKPAPGDKTYTKALELGGLLAKHGHVVLTGGYMGTMEAVSRGAAEAGGHVIGVTCSDIEKWRAVGANQWVKEEIRKTTLMDRILGLIENCDAALALPGGPGTLAEISLMWNLMIIDSHHRRPLILIGDGWRSVIDQVYTSLDSYVSASQRGLVQFAANNRAALEMLK